MRQRKCKSCNGYFVPPHSLFKYCKACNDLLWKEFDAEHEEEYRAVSMLVREKGHTHHCASRMVWGDSECECDLYEKGYDPYAWTEVGIKELDI